MFKEQKLKLRDSLQGYANAETKTWWENYVKESAPFMGVKMPDIRTVLHQWHEDHVDRKLAESEQLDLALALFDEEYTEEKLAGILFLQEILLPSGAIKYEREINRFADLFESGKIYDWNICDWFCVKVLGSLILENGLDCAKRISQWRNAGNLWQARASLVPFVKVADSSVYYSEIEVSCQVLIRREERFAKTAVGWILRDLSRFDAGFVRKVIEGNIESFSLESLKNATKYFEKDEQTRYKKMLKNAR